MHEVVLRHAVDELELEVQLALLERRGEPRRTALLVQEAGHVGADGRALQRARRTAHIVRLEQMLGYELEPHPERHKVGEPLEEVVDVEHVEEEQPEPQDGEDLLRVDVDRHHALHRVSMQPIAEHANLKVAEHHRVKYDQTVPLAEQVAVLHQIHERLVAELESAPEAIRRDVGVLLAVEHTVVVEEVAAHARRQILQAELCARRARRARRARGRLVDLVTAGQLVAFELARYELIQQEKLSEAVYYVEQLREHVYCE